MSPIPFVDLNNGTKIPIIGIGGGPSALTAEACDAAKKWILTAIKVRDTSILRPIHQLSVTEAGYRHIDTALLYGTEKVIGEAIKESGIPREEFFITTKLPFNRQDRVTESFELSLKNLGVEYVDLYLMHWPMAIPYKGPWLDLPYGADGSVITVDSPTFNESYAEMEKIYASGRAKAIGVSNFSIKTLEELLKTATVVPAVNQIERHPYLAEHDLIAYHKKKGHKNAIREDPVMNEIAAKHGVSPTQVILAWHIAGGVIILPKSENEQRQKDNINLPTLDEDDLKRIDGLDRGERLCNKIDKNGKVFGWTREQLGW
ncbi:NADP-dependent oxidoreductase domain-containing protein [Desarmillaria tabescens]|uniref:NADP-dependent oxidoreductase domain-containing protein n=1 Tax=Armillaria tabescens TaxID=1929756 RepID=A0AA39JTT9_ARMTA|nr:NADP-dependent oxidoreductase domain-containing protein [Desarmillaria tabescens]KAK0448422.1 NADP-dependent oxidoreductase domain-containing protein [Desarmillaria tabescens]